MSAFRKSSNILVLLMIAVTGINFLQIAFTELIMDEAYYWYFARDLEWGYFDHPPMVPFLIDIGQQILEGEAGLRLFAPLLFTLTLITLWDLTDHPLKKYHPWLFFWLTGSLGLMAAFGFFMVPDTPLLFFSALMLKAYKEHLKSPGFMTVLALAICMAAIMYSKYQGALFILFVILSRPANLKDLKIWGAILLAMVFYLPHLYWLYEHDFVSVSYHLIERANSAYKLKFTLHYLLNAMALGGLAFPLLYFAVIKSKIKSPVDRALKTVFYGFFIFFLFSSFNRKTQIQWINLINIPLILFGFRYALDHLHFRKWTYRLSAVAVILLIYVRFALVFPELSPITYEAHGNRQWTKKLYEKSNGLPVVFHNSYRDAATYAYYTGAEVHSLNDVSFRRNQFDIDQSEARLRNRPVVLVSQHRLKNATLSVTRPFNERTWHGVVLDSFNTYSKLRFQIDREQFNGHFPEKITTRLHNPYKEQVPVNKLRIEGITFDDNRKIIDTFALKAEDPDLMLPPGEIVELQLRSTREFNQRRASYFQIGLGYYGFQPGFEGNMVNVSPIERNP